MNEMLFELGKLHQGQKDIESAVRDGFADMKSTLATHAAGDHETFEAHAGRLTKLEHASVRVGMVAAAVAFGLSVIATAAARAYFG